MERNMYNKNFYSDFFCFMSVKLELLVNWIGRTLFKSKATPKKYISVLDI